jgi:hypothetical protein
MEQQTQTNSIRPDRRSSILPDMRSDSVRTDNGTSRYRNNYKSMQPFMNPNIQTNIGECLDLSVYASGEGGSKLADRAEEGMNMTRPFVYTVLIFLALCLVSYIAGA